MCYFIRMCNGKLIKGVVRFSKSGRFHFHNDQCAFWSKIKSKKRKNFQSTTWEILEKLLKTARIANMEFFMSQFIHCEKDIPGMTKNTVFHCQ